MAASHTPRLSVPAAAKPSVFAYADYRAFLKDWYAHRSRAEGGLSYRRMAREMGVKSPGHFSLVFNGQANLTLKLMDRFVRFLSLGKREADYFHALVLYTQARTQTEKKRCFDRMLTFRQFRARIIEDGQYQFFENWHYTAVREILAIHDCKDDYKTLGQLIEPPLSAEEARKAMEMLKRLGMVVKDAQGIHRRTDAVLTTGPDARGMAIQNFLGQSLELAKGALDRLPRSERMSAATTVSMSRAAYEELREELRAFRGRILEAAQKDAHPEQVYQFQFHAFPLSKPVKPKAGK
jgi:uncharacterized protein (TIGR02147 family)